jgi:N-methylhydantoinase A
LDRSAAEQAILSHIARPLGLSLERAAIGILDVANGNMADALRVISIGRGFDPRDFVLVAFGGAGPLHGVALAQELSIPIVLVPPNPGVTSALGGLLVDLQHDLAAMFFGDAENVDPSRVEAEFRRLEEDARRRLEAENALPSDISLSRSIDMRYRGQWRSLAISVDKHIESLADAISSFHQEHERHHRYRRDDAPVEIYRLNLRATGRVPKASFRAVASTSHTPPQPLGLRQVIFDETLEPLPTRVYARTDLHAGTSLSGPAVVAQLDSTILVPPGTRATVDEFLNIRIYLTASHHLPDAIHTPEGESLISRSSAT